MKTKTLSNDFLELEYRTDALRITSLKLKGKKKLFADLSHMPPISTDHGDFYFHGGHRLWHAPESMPRTYIPDSGDIKVADTQDGVILEAQTEPATGIRKRIKIQLATASPTVTLTHTLFNDGLWAVNLAPWAITQIRLGGTVILPLSTENVDSDGLLPNRQLSFWPYANLSDPRLTLKDGYTFFKAEPAPPFKMGYFNLHGWLGYWIDGMFFKKTFGTQTDAIYPDNNCNAEIYCNEDFVELESLAPFIQLLPGASVEHVEFWEVSDALPANLKERIEKTQQSRLN